MKIAQGIKHVGNIIKHNSSTILTGIGVAGVFGTAIIAVKATPQALGKLDLAFQKKNGIINNSAPDIEDWEPIDLTPIEVMLVVWKDYLPAFGMAVVSGGAIIGAQSINLRRQAVLISGLTLSETAFREYQERVAFEAPTKDRKVRDDIAREKVEKNPVSSSEVIIVGDGEQLFYEGYTGRYFQSTKQKVDAAVNKLNFHILNQEYASLNELYQTLGLPSVTTGETYGWTAEQPLELDFSTHMTDDDRPAIVIEFVRAPQANYWKGFR